MNEVQNWLSHDHSMYEELLSQCQDAIDMQDWDAAETSFQEMVWHLKGHMAMEEEVLYPAYEERILMPNGPTEALREEHNNIIRIITDMAYLLKSKDPAHILDCLNLLENLMIKHHEKEEDIFLPMASLIMQMDRDQLLEQLHAFDASKAKRKWDI